MRLLDLEVYEYIRAYKRYDKGYLPNEGGWLEQPAKFNDAMDIVENEIAKMSDELSKKQMKHD